MNISKISKATLYLSILSFNIWTGSALAKVLLTYNFFIPPHFALKSFVNQQTVTAVTNTLAPVYALSTAAMLGVLVFFILFVFLSKLSLRNNGWLFISLILVVLLSFAEFFLYFKFDKAFIESVFWGVPDGNTHINLLIQRFEKFSSFPVIEMLSACALIFLFLFQPLRKNEN